MAVANSAGGLAVLLAALFGGFLMSRAQMPALTRWLSSLSFVRWPLRIGKHQCYTAPSTHAVQTLYLSSTTSGCAALGTLWPAAAGWLRHVVNQL